MNPKVLFSASIVMLACATAAPCQWLPCNPGNRLGLTDGWDSPMQGDGTSFTHTAGVAASTAAGDVLTRIESDYMYHWGLDPNDPTAMTKAILGVEFVLQDEDGSTVEPYTIVGYNEDPASPNFPDVNPTGSGRFLNTAALMSPGGTPAGQGAAWIICITFGATGTTPVTGIPDNQDVFIGLGIDHSAGGFPNDGLSTHAVGNDQTTPPWDDAGRCANLPPPMGTPAGTPLIDQLSYVCRVPTASLGGAPNGAAVYTNDNMNGGYFSQNRFEVHLPAAVPGGVAVTRHAAGSNYPAATGQTHYSGAFTTNGTPNGVSGFFPSAATGDIRGTDDVGYVFFAPPNTPTVIFAGSGANQIPGLMISNLGPAGPNSTGYVCLDLTGAIINFVGLTDANGRFGVNLSLGSARSILASIGCTSLYWQAVGITSIAPLTVNGTGCARQDI